MDRKRVIDMSQAHLIPERIRAYAPKVAEVLDQYPVADQNAQRYYELLREIEIRLMNDPMNSPFFKKTREIPDGKKGLEALQKGDKNWLEKRYPKNYESIYRAPG